MTIGYHPSPNPRSAAVARELLLAGANWRLVDVAGRTARELAALHRQRDVEVVLREGGSLSLSDHASALLFIWRSVWGAV